MSSVPDRKSEMEAMIIQYLPLVRRIADRINVGHSADFDKEDLISVGVLGLIDAIKRFDASKGVPFQTYAKWRINGAILDECRKSSRISRDMLKKSKEISAARSKLRQELQREPDDDELCKFLSISPYQLYKVESSIHLLSQYSLEAILFSGEDDELRLSDAISDTNMLTPEEEALIRERRELLKKVIEKLTEKERLVLNLYYKEELTLKEIGEILNVTVSRVSQIHGRVLARLRELLDTM